MLAEETVYNGFACPQTGMDRQFLSLVVTEHARQVIEEFTRRHSSRLETNGNGLKTLISEWLLQDISFESVWNLAFGSVHLALHVPDRDCVERSAAALCLRQHEYGQEGKWGIHFQDPARFRFDRWLLPPTDSIEVIATGEAVSVRIGAEDGWRNIVFSRGPTGWDAIDIKPLPILKREELRWPILSPTLLPPGSVALKWLEKNGFDFSRVVDPIEASERCEGSLNLLSDFAPTYLSWVCDVVRDLLPLPPKSSTLSSLSDEFTPGVITFAVPASRCGLAEMLVHESTHQYLHIVKTLEPLDDGTDETLYFSPFRNTGRPIYNIVLAYHAFANVLLFYRMAISRGVKLDEPELLDEEQMAELETQLHTLEQALQTTKALTPVGRALWEPLYERLNG